MPRDILNTGACLLAVAIATCPSAGFAQQAANDRAAAAEANSQDIVVTAQRRAERLEDVPLSITAVTGDVLEKAGIDKFEEIGQVSAGTLISRTGVFVQPSIRGITSTAVGAGQENNIAVYVDGFYQPDSLALGSDFSNVDNIQILKGPQGTLYGRNATGGAILITTKEPNSERLVAEISGAYGNFQDRRISAYISMPITDTVSFGISGYARASDGYIRDIAGIDAAPYRNRNVRAKLKYASGDFTAVLGFNYDYRKDARGLAYTFISEQFLGTTPVPPVGPLRTTARDKVSYNTQPIFNTRQVEGTLKLQWTNALGTLSSYTSYLDQNEHNGNDSDGTKINFQFVEAFLTRETFQHAADYAMKFSDAFDVTIGGLYYHDVGGTLAPLQSGGVRIQLTTNKLRTEAYAGFVDATLRLGENFYVNAGVRYSHEKKNVRAFAIERIAFLGGPGVIAPSTTTSFSQATPRLTLRYEISPGTNVYASYNKGFKSGTFNTVGQSRLAITTPVKPEKVDAFEVGFKTARGGIRFDSAAYYYDYRDLQVSSLQTVNGAPITFLNNAATAEIYGAEASLSTSIIENLNTRFGIAYTHARYKDFANASVQLVIGGRNVSGQIQDLSGRRIARSADWNINGGFDYTIPMGESDLVLAGNMYYTSKYNPTTEVYTPATGRARFEQGGYILASASADWKLANGLSLGAYVENIGNKRYKLLDTANGQGSYRAYASPRTYGVRAGYKY